MTRKKGRPGDPPLQGSTNAAALPPWLDPDGSHGKTWVLLMKPAEEGVALPSNPFTLAKSIQSTVGTITEAYRNKEGQFVLKVRGEQKVKKLMRMDQLIDGTKVEVVEHPRLNQIRVVVTCNSVGDMSDEELKAEPSLREQDVIDVKRFRKAGKAIATMVLTIRGTVAPEAIFFGYDRCRTKPYVQPPMQCFKCYEYGHPKVRCSAQEVCRNCSTPHPIIKDDNGHTICQKPARCLHCNGPHSPASRTCPKYLEEEAIEKIRSTQGKSPREARRIVEEQKQQGAKSYAAVTSVQDRITAAQKTTDLAELKKELDGTQKALNRALEEIKRLKAEIKANTKDEPKKDMKPKKQTQRTSQSDTEDSNGTSVAMETDGETNRQRRDSESSICSTAGKRRISESSTSSGSTIVDSDKENQEKNTKPSNNIKPTLKDNSTPTEQGNKTNNKKSTTKRSKK